MSIRVYFEGQVTLTIKKEDFNDVKKSLIKLHQSSIKKEKTLLNKKMELREVFSTFGLDAYPNSDGDLVGFAIRSHQEGPPANITSTNEKQTWHEHCLLVFSAIKQYMGDGAFAFVLGENSLYTKFSYGQQSTDSITMNCEILDRDNKKDVIKLLENYLEQALSIGIPIEKIQEKIDDIKVSEIVEA